MSGDLTITSTLSTIADRLNSNISTLTTLQSEISDAYDKISGGTSTKKYTNSANYEIQSMKQQEATFDTEFEEAEANLQKTGGKTRRQTLQEFVILFFFISFGVFMISVAVLKFIETRQPVEGLKMIGILLLLLAISIALIIRLG